MSRSTEPSPLVLSLLDRLQDDDPENRREVPPSQQQALRQLKESVCRDLQDLLNTRCLGDVPPDPDGLLIKSLLNYGIPDFSGANFGAGSKRDELRRTIEDAIISFEPRFRRVRVSLQDNVDPADRILRLRIDAVLSVTPSPQLVVFDTQLEPASGNFAVNREAT